MKRLITLFTLLLAIPSLAIAQELFTATSGSLVVHAGDTSTSFFVAGPGFSMSGDMTWPLIDNPWQLGIQGSHIMPDVTGVTAIGAGAFPMDLSLNVHGVQVDASSNTSLVNFAEAEFSSDLTVPGPGIHQGSFFFRSFFEQPPGFCDQCWGFSGNGIVTYDVAPTTIPGQVNFLDATYEFTGPTVPEPSTVSLLLIALAGLALLGRRRGTRATLLPAV